MQRPLGFVTRFRRLVALATRRIPPLVIAFVSTIFYPLLVDAQQCTNTHNLYLYQQFEFQSGATHYPTPYQACASWAEVNNVAWGGIPVVYCLYPTDPWPFLSWEAVQVFPPDDPPVNRYNGTNTVGIAWNNGTPVSNCLPKNAGPPPCPTCLGNPIVVSSGNKIEAEVDDQGAGANPLAIKRMYNSGYYDATAYGAPVPWSMQYLTTIVADGTLGGFGVTRPDGKVIFFVPSGSAYVGPPDFADTLTPLMTGSTQTGWAYRVAADDSLETYSYSSTSPTPPGNLLSITGRNGQTITMTYASYPPPAEGLPASGVSMLMQVTNQFGRQLNLTYYQGTPATITDSQQNTTTYNYDAYGRIGSVQYADGTIKQYLYNESANTAGANLTNALTGIIDENNSRFATFQYNSSGQPLVSEHAGNVENYTVVYTTDGNGNILSTAATDPLNTTRTYSFTSVLGVNRLSSLAEPAGAGSSAATKSSTYDANGNLASQTDYKGNLTCYVYNQTTNLETGRVEGLAPGSTCPANIATYTTTANTVQRKILTQNHAYWHLPIEVAEPLKITTYAYNGDGGVYCAPTSAMSGAYPIGVLCTKTEQATTDPTGSSGFSATPTGSPRVWKYTYNGYGQVLTAVDPLNNTTTTTYYASTDTAHSPPWYYIGDIDTVKDAVGHITTYTQYDGNGRLLSMTDPNGVITTLTYKPRGWLATKTVTQPSGGAQTTTYGYDNVGQLTQVTLPDSTYIKYAYDPAHRLTTITDSFGDTINYTLDNMGNRTVEATKDPSGNLTRNVARVYDALSRLQTVTGALQ